MTIYKLNRSKSQMMKRIIILGCIVALPAGLGAWLLRKQPQIISDKDMERALQQTRSLIPVAIIGSGPAGLSAAIYTARAKLHTIVFAGPEKGGQLTGTTYVENWPGIGRNLGPDIMQRVENQAISFGARIVRETVKNCHFDSWPYRLELSDGSHAYALSVIIATGSTPRKLGIPGEQAYWGKGVSACAVCDAAFCKNKRVVVIGGGDSAIEQVTQLSSYAREIVLLVRGSALRASKAMQERLTLFPHVTISYDTKVQEIMGNGDHVTQIRVLKDKEVAVLDVDAVFLAIGHDPGTVLFKDKLPTDEQGYLLLQDGSQATRQAGVFAAGDVSDHRYRQAAVASGDGVKAALDAERFLMSHGYTEKVARKFSNNWYDPLDKQSAEEIYEISSLAEFDNLVLKAQEKTVIVDFYRTQCPSCVALKPVIEQYAALRSEQAIVYGVNLDTIEELSLRYKLASVPYLLVFRHGLEVARLKASRQKIELFDELDAYTR